MSAVSEKEQHTQRWAALPERGSPIALRLFHWAAKVFGRSIARLLLFPVTLYFFLSAHSARRMSYQYLERLRGRRPHWWLVFHHLYYFAVTILDRVYLLTGEFHRFDIKVHERELLHRQVERRKGCILLGSHLGSFEVLRALGVTRVEYPLKVLMDVVHNENLTRFLDALNPEIASTVIVPDRPDTLLKVKESLDAGFLVGTLGDRPTSDGKTVQCRFLGAPATFPIGAIVIAAMMHCPVILFFGIYRGGNRYEIYFEKFADEIVLNRDRRVKDIQHWMQRYVDRLEHYTRLAPYNWFNFYPFWD